jgi:CelD/BcsL family acetyltransferase involved in cellulose biosynthesis
MTLRVEPIADLPAAEACWRELGGRGDNVFATWEWAETWWRHFGAGRPLRLVRLRDPGGEAVAVVPLFEAAAGPIRVLRFVGHTGAELGGPVCAPERRAEVAQAVRALGRSAPWPWDVILAERLAGDAWGPLLGGTLLRREASPVLRTEGLTWSAFLAGRSRNLREQAGRLERRLVREHGARFRLADDPARLDRDLDALFALHDDRWGDDVSPGFTGAARAFQRDFAPRALANGWLRLWLLEIAGEPVAAWYGFRFGGAEWYYQAGRRSDWAAASVGAVLMAHALRRAFDDGVGVVRLLRGDQRYKVRWASDDPGVETRALHRGARGTLAATAIAGALRLPPRARKPLVARLG